MYHILNFEADKFVTVIKDFPPEEKARAEAWAADYLEATDVEGLLVLQGP